ncbi:lipopolysaccharide assembly protein LapB [Terribacillus sp. DMT04]|uniref:tetratricopeptide repeat protein n=1 Tax=Terribacillus sp. DMT04 TaxID=2850441 RepID=UPI001C2C585C|nr:tetratricopeptide repeat protein [Terribacillus sp. DMT04]QXE02286.1 tetratricopeptide repeat protein [Terribacillus sp. DMT04]
MGQNISKQVDISAEMDNWSISIRLDKREAATSIYERLKRFMNDYTTETLINFLLLESRFYLMHKDTVNGANSIDKAKAYLPHFNDTHRHYFHLAEGILFYNETHYPEALNCFEKAEKYLSHLDDPVEIGEFHLRQAMTYFNLDITTLSVLHAERAIEALKPYKTFEFLLAHAEMLQGLNYVDLRNFERAEEYLHSALTTFKRVGNNNFIASTNLNLGVLYVKSDLPAAAIRYLEEALKHNQARIRLKILYLLADCYWKTDQTSKALETYTNGFNESIEKDDLAKKWEFAMLHKKYVDRINFESVWQEGIEYFRRINDFYNVKRFSTELAEYYTEHSQYELATKYYSMALLQ